MRISGIGFHGITNLSARVQRSEESGNTWLQIEVEGMDYRGEPDSSTIISFHPDEGEARDLLVKLWNSIDGSKADE